MILPGLFPIVGSTEREARERKERLDSFLDFDAELLKLAKKLGVDAELLELDKLVSPDLLAADSGGASRGFLEATINLSQSENLTVRQILDHNPGGHRLIVGTPEQIADDIELWFRSGAADGFNLNADSFPTGLEPFVDHVVPLLRKRGIFRHEYTGTTLRDNLGLARPRSRHESSGTGRAA